MMAKLKTKLLMWTGDELRKWNNRRNELLKKRLT